MQRSAGLYRMHYGSGIVQAFYDWDTQEIGPYKVPIKLTYVVETSQHNHIPVYRLYQELLRTNDALAVYNVNNYCIAVLYRTKLVQVPIVENDNTKDLLMWEFNSPIDVPVVQPVGFIKTHQKCLAVTEAPSYLLMDFERNLIGLKSKMTGSPMVKPPYTLYKDLIKDTKAKAIYYDVELQKNVYIYE